MPGQQVMDTNIGSYGNSCATVRIQRKPGTMAQAALLAVGIFVSGCAKQQAAPSPRPPVPVVVGTAVQKSVPVELDAVGNVEPFSEVSIKAQVPGQLQEVHFKEGDFVRKGQLLLTIDPRPFQAALAQAQAALARDKAVAANSRTQAQRYDKLLAEGVAPAQQVESFRSEADAAEAGLKSDEAAVQTAQLNLEYCTIYSPIDGRTGTLMLKPGNLLKVADVPIVIINQVNPIYVNFAVPQQYWPDIKKFMASGSLRVRATVPRDSGFPEQGTVTFVDNNVDPTTGTIHLRATFSNSANRLWPGLYVNIVLTLSEESRALVIPAQAILLGDNGSFVYVVGPEKTVEPRTVVTDRTVNGETVIEKGLKPGETIVIDGQVRLEPHSKIEIKTAGSDAAPTAQ
jgi:membrane fusion protein, multidrug efflux system